MAIAGEFQLVYGTSASSPVVAAMLSAVNDARLAAGKAPIGFINPTVRLIPDFLRATLLSSRNLLFYEYP